MKLTVRRESWPLRHPFRIAGFVQTECAVVVAELEHEGAVGRGEAKGVQYLGDTADAAYHQIAALAGDLERGLARAELQERLPPGGARNALDCALWDLEAKLSGSTVWRRLGLEPHPLTTLHTVGIEEDPQAMAAFARASPCLALKIKLDAQDPVERVRAVRGARPDARLFVDANQSWSFELLREAAPALAALGVEMIEQPLPRLQDDALEGYRAPLPLCADESCQSSADMDLASRRYQMINIKLDKAGGLTEALHMMDRCRQDGMNAMVGCMISTSLAMAPAFVVAQRAVMADLDAPLFLTRDRANGLEFDACSISPPSPLLWG
jgi:L-alanine-DL-glutamate epimerase-like enolase superfamily enzyme